MDTPISAIYPMLRFSNAVLVMDLLDLKGIITKADILRADTQVFSHLSQILNAWKHVCGSPLW